MLRQRHIPLKNEKEPPKGRLLFVLFHVEQGGVRKLECGIVRSLESEEWSYARGELSANLGSPV